MTTTRYFDNAAIQKCWPRTWAERHAEYARRRNVVMMGPHNERDIQRLCLFRGTNGEGTVIHEAQRVSPLIRYVAQVDTMILSRPWSLNLRPDVEADENDPRLTRGMETWRRSHIDDRSRVWSDILSTEADLYIEAGVDGSTPQRPIVTGYRPQYVKIWLDDQGLEIIKAVIEYEVEDPDASTPNAMIKIVRTLTPTEISVKRGDAPPVSAPHNLGRVPLLHVQWSPGPDPYLGVPPWWGLEDAIAVHDSATTMLSVMGTKRANPALFAEGFVLPSGAAVPGLDGGASETTVIAGPQGSDLRPVSPGMEGVTALSERATDVHGLAAATVAELLYTEAGANASGTAIAYKAQALTSKASPPDRSQRRAVGLAIAMAHALVDRVPWADALDVYDVTAGPILPMDRAAEIAAAVSARETGLVKDVDTVRAFQDLGIVPRDVDPETYAAEAREADGQQTERTAAAFGRIRGPEPAAALRVVDDPDAGSA